MRRALEVAFSGLAVAVCAVIVTTSAALPAVASTGLAGATSGGTSTNYLNKAAAALSHGNLVYVSPDTPDYSSQTASQVAPQPGYPIALVELPADATDEVGGSGQVFANELNDLTQQRYIVAVAFVSDSLGTATYFTASSRGVPQSQTDHVRDQAANVGKGAEDTLSTFGLFMAQWLQANPGSLQPLPVTSHSAAASRPVPAGHGGVSPVLLVLLLVPIAGVGYVLFIRPRRKAKTIAGLLLELEELASQIQNRDVRQTVQSIRNHAERYLVRVQENLSEGQVQDARRTTWFNLTKVIKVARGYIDMAQRPDEWPGDTNARLLATAGSLSKFDGDLLTAIQQANEGILAEMEVDTSVLEHSVI